MLKKIVFCVTFVVRTSKSLLLNTIKRPYISTGFRSWKKAPECFKKHEDSNCHGAALAYEIVVPECKDVGELTSTTLVKERLELRQYFKVLMESIQYLARRGMALRGDNDDNINLTQLLRLREKDRPKYWRDLNPNEIKIHTS